MLKKKRVYHENKTCRAWLEFMALQYPAAYGHIIRIENEGLTNRANAVSLGLHVGASDYFIACPTLKHYGFFMEVKPDGWKLTESKKPHYERQIMFGDKMKQRGYYFAFCVGIDECIQATNDYFKGG
jgi:hypothetical protein